MKRKADNHIENGSVKPPTTSTIVTRKVAGIENPLIKTIEKIKIDVPEGLPTLHTTAVAVGNCDSGKTNWIYNLVAAYQKHGSFTRIFLISPTADNNKAAILDIDPEDIYKGKQALDQGVQCIASIEDKVKEEAKSYELYEKYCDAYYNWLYGIETIKERIMLETAQFEPPVYRPRPSCAVIMDDLSNTNIFSISSENTFINLFLRFRHVYGIGISFFLAVQNFVGLPKRLRQNVRQFYLWKTHDSTQLKAIYQQIAQGCTEEEFYEAFEYATATPHNFLTVDMSAKDGVFLRKNFNEEIIFKRDKRNEELITIK